MLTTPFRPSLAGDTILRSRPVADAVHPETINASYESLEKFYKSNLETLRISDTGQNNYKLDYCGRPQADEDPPRRNAVEESVYETLDEAVSSDKQRQLSDWYYIKTSPKPRQWNNEWRNKNGKVDYLEQYPLKSSSTSHFPDEATVVPAGDVRAFAANGGRSSIRDPRRLPHPPEIDVQSSRMYQNLVLNRVHSLPRQEDNSTPSSSSTIKHSNFLVNSTFIQSESNLKDFHFYENLIEQKKSRVPPPAFAPQSPVSMNIVDTSSSTTTTTATDASKVSQPADIVNECSRVLFISPSPSMLPCY